jgi:aminoacylase
MASGVRPARRRASRRAPAAAALAELLLVSACFACCAAASDADAAVERFREYLRIRTEQPTPDYVAAAAFLEAQAHDIGYACCVCDLGVTPDGAPLAGGAEACVLTLRRRLQVELIRYASHKPLVLMTWPGRNASLQSILLNSHTDVVPAEPSFWRRASALLTYTAMRSCVC